MGGPSLLNFRVRVCYRLLSAGVWKGYLEELVGIDVIHINVDHPQHVLDLLEAHLVVFVLISLAQNVMDPDAAEVKESTFTELTSSSSPPLPAPPHSLYPHPHLQISLCQGASCQAVEMSCQGPVHSIEDSLLLKPFLPWSSVLP